MSIQDQLDAVRKNNLDKQILDAFEKLNQACQDLTGGMTLEQLVEEVERIDREDFYPEDPDEQPEETKWTQCRVCNEYAVPNGCDCMICGNSPHTVL